MVKIFSKKIKRMLTYLTMVCMIVLSGIVFYVLSNSFNNKNFYNETSQAYSIAKPSGAGTQESPYLISKESELFWIQVNIQSGALSGFNYYKQTNDITLTYYWTPIGDGNNMFDGEYDGQYFSITGMQLAKWKEYNGLFGKISNQSVISHVNLFGSYNQDMLGIYMDIDNSISSIYLGGIVGYGGTVKYCTNNATIGYYMPVKLSIYSGGISGSSSDVYNCCNKGTINVGRAVDEELTNYFFYVGGIIGHGGNVYNSYNTAEVQGNAASSSSLIYSAVGGIAGAGSDLYNSYNLGNVILGSLLYINNPGAACVGGIIGYAQVGTEIKDCFAVCESVQCNVQKGGDYSNVSIGYIAGRAAVATWLFVWIEGAHIYNTYAIVDKMGISYAESLGGNEEFLSRNVSIGNANGIKEIVTKNNPDSKVYFICESSAYLIPYAYSTDVFKMEKYYNKSEPLGTTAYIDEENNLALNRDAYWSKDWDFTNSWYYDSTTNSDNNGYPKLRVDVSSAEISLTQTSYTYNGTSQAPSVKTFSFNYMGTIYIIHNPSSLGTVTYSTDGVNAGTVTVTFKPDYYKYSDSLEFYFAGQATTTYTINKRDISFTVTNRSMIYGESYTVPENSYTITSGSVASGDTISPTYKILSKSSESKDVTSTIKTCDVGSYTISFSSGLNSNNYNITITQGTLTINRRTVEITPVVSMIYGDSAPSENYSVSNLVNSDSKSNVIKGTATYKYNGSTTKPSKTSQAGTLYTVSISGLDTIEEERGKNYRISYKTSKLTISKKKANIKVYIGDQLDKTALSITYGENLPIMTYKVDGLINGETASGGEFYIRKRTSNYSIENSDVSIADGDYLEYSQYGYYIMVRNVVLSNNYSPFYADTSGTSIINNNYAAKLTVNKKAVTITPSDVSIKYGDPVPTSYVFDVSELPSRDYVDSYPTYAVYNNSSKISYLAGNYLGTSHYISDMVNVGSYTLKRDSNYLNIYNSSGKDVSASYNITYKQGTFTITQFDFSRDSYSYTGLTNFVFNGLERTQGLLKIKNSNQVPYNNEGEYFRESIHYTIGYENNIEAGTAKVIISGEGTNCIGSTALEFDIEPFDLNNATITLSYYTDMYDGTSKEPEVTITCDGIAINQTKETYTHRNYSVRYENNLNSGTATVTAYGQDGYNMINSISITFEIRKNYIELEAFYDGSSAFYYGDTTSFYSYKINGLVDHDKTESYIKSISGNGDVIYQFVDGYDALYDVKDTNGNVVNTQTAVAGSYTINVRFVSIPAMILNNYDLSYKTNELVINPRTIYVYATSQSIDYSGSAPSYTYSVDNIVNSDRVTGNATYRVFTLDGVEVTNVSTASKGSYYIYVYIENLDILNSSNQSVLSSYNVVIKNGDADFAEGGRLIIGTYTLNASMLYIDPDSFTYDTTAKTPDIRVIFDSSDLRKDFDYSCVIEDNIVAGKAKITITGLNNFSGTIYGEYTINKLNLTNNSDVAVILDNYNFIFNGSDNEPRITVKYKDYTLNNIYTDYTFDFENNKDVGTAKVTINGVNSCEGYVEEEFTISKFDLSDADVNLTVLRDTYSGYGDNLGGDENITTDVKVRLVDNSNQTTQLVNNTDYTITYEDVDTLFNGEGKVIITGKGNYSGEAIATFETSALWDSFIGSTTLSGSGTQSDPYIISTALEFVKLSNFINTNPHSTRYVKLTQNIDLSGRYFTPIGTTTGDVKRFSGVFDGNNRTIIGLTIKSDIDSTGLFGNVSNATINNLGIMDANVTSTADNVGIIAGNAWNTKIQNCYTSGNVSGKNYVGGMIGYFSNTEIANCYQRAEVSGSSNVGGFAGGTENDGINIKDSYVQCIINGEGAIGGLIGKASCTNEASDNAVINISASFYEGIINAQSTSIDSTNAVGGIIGYVNCRANVEGSLACKLSNFYVVVTIETTLASSNYVNNIIGYQAAVNAPAMENYYNNVTIKYLGNTLSSKKYSGEFSNDVWFYSERFNKGTPSLKSIFKIGYGILYNNIESVFPGKDFTSVE